MNVALVCKIGIIVGKPKIDPGEQLHGTESFLMLIDRPSSTEYGVLIGAI